MDTEKSSNGLDDAEITGFVGELRSAREVDFDRPLYLVEIYYSGNVTQHIVNAESEEEAHEGALAQAMQNGEPILKAMSIGVARIEDRR